MPLNKGKAWEAKFRSDWSKSFPNGTIDRLYDPTNGYIAISNVSDFIGYDYPLIFYTELKSHKGNTFPFTCLPQYEKLTAKVGIKGVRAGVVLWMIDHDLVLYVPISTITKMKNDGKKSINIKDIDNYHIIKIPGVKKRVFIECDYRCLKDLEEGC